MGTLSRLQLYWDQRVTAGTHPIRACQQNLPTESLFRNTHSLGGHVPINRATRKLVFLYLMTNHIYQDHFRGWKSDGRPSKSLSCPEFLNVPVTLRSAQLPAR